MARAFAGRGRPDRSHDTPTKQRGRSARRGAEAAGTDARSDPESIYLAEHYLPGVDAQRVDAHVSRLAEAAEGARRDGLDVSFLGSAGLPGDESVLSLFSAPSVDQVARTIELAEVAVDRIVPVLWRAGVLETRSRGEA